MSLAHVEKSGVRLDGKGSFIKTVEGFVHVLGYLGSGIVGEFDGDSHFGLVIFSNAFAPNVFSWGVMPANF